MVVLVQNFSSKSSKNSANSELEAPASKSQTMGFLKAMKIIIVINTVKSKDIWIELKLKNLKIKNIHN